MKLKISIILSVVFCFIILTGCSLPQITSETPGPAVNSDTGYTTGDNNLSQSPLSMETLLESIYTRVNPSVVNIQVIEKSQTTLEIPGFQANPGQQQYSSAMGSGFVWDTSGNIVTNNHVVSGAQSISVIFSDDNIYPAAIVGADPDSDLAVIKVNAPDQELHPVMMADSTGLKVGQLAIAIGNPFGLQSTMTVGYISALGRLLPANENTSYSIPDIIQTDAPLNPGNSGGVLLNYTGSVIGVTSAIATQSGSSSGIGFAIPSSIVKQVVPTLIKDGHYTHPWLGVAVLTLTPDITESMKLESNQKGALVEQVVANSPADKAELRASQLQLTINGSPVSVGGDVIIGIDDQLIRSSDDLVAYLFENGAIGQTITLTILRDGKQMQVPVTLAARPAS
jgi:serine protease Do